MKWLISRLSLLAAVAEALTATLKAPPPLATASTDTLALPFDDLARLVGGTGRARSVWDSLRRGVPGRRGDLSF